MVFLIVCFIIFFLFVNVRVISNEPIDPSLYTIPMSATKTLVEYRNKSNNVIFKEITRYDTESVMLRTDINVRLLIPHTELDKRYEKLDN